MKQVSTMGDMQGYIQLYPFQIVYHISLYNNITLYCPLKQDKYQYFRKIWRHKTSHSLQAGPPWTEVYHCSHCRSQMRSLPHLFDDLFTTLSVFHTCFLLINVQMNMCTVFEYFVNKFAHTSLYRIQTTLIHNSNLGDGQ